MAERSELDQLLDTFEALINEAYERMTPEEFDDMEHKIDELIYSVVARRRERIQP